MAVRLRMKQMGRKHRPFYRVCAMDGRSPRDGKVLEELGSYDPMVEDTDARTVLNCERIDYWLGVGAQPSEKVRVLIKKYGSGGTHREAQQTALDRMAQPKAVPEPGKPASMPKKEEPAAEAPPDAAAPEAAAPETSETAAPAEETAAAEPVVVAELEGGKEANTEEAAGTEEQADAKEDTVKTDVEKAGEEKKDGE